MDNTQGLSVLETMAVEIAAHLAEMNALLETLASCVNERRGTFSVVNYES